MAGERVRRDQVHWAAESRYWPCGTGYGRPLYYLMQYKHAVQRHGKGSGARYGLTT